MRLSFIAGNHKMYKTVNEVVEFGKDFLERVKNVNSNNVEILIAPPFTSITKLSEIFNNTNIKLGAQNCCSEEEGAFTGEVSVKMLSEIGVDYVILGHSERRHIFNECDSLINKKVKTVLKADLKPILCIGEKEEERELGLTNCVNETQLRKGLDGISKEDMNNVTIAYEPVWAIGTGKTATPKDAQEAHKYIRELLSNLYDKNLADSVRILYGGSVKPENVKDLMAQDDIDGALVGGASLKSDSFEKIVKFDS